MLLVSLCIQVPSRGRAFGCGEGLPGLHNPFVRLNGKPTEPCNYQLFQGVLSKYSTEGLGLSACAQMFDAADTNHDGKLSREEFANMMRMKQAAEAPRTQAPVQQMPAAVMPRPTLPATQPKAQAGAIRSWALKWHIHA